MTKIKTLKEALEILNQYLKRFIVLTSDPRKLLCVFTAYTYIYKHFDFASYILIHSAEPRCGKSRVLKHLQWLCYESKYISGGSPSAFLREVDMKARKNGIVLLLDEVDKIINLDTSDNKFFGICNSGIEQGNPFILCEPSGKEKGYTIKEYDTFSPKAFGLINPSIVDGATRDRCIEIKMNRKTLEETKQFKVLRNVRKFYNSPEAKETRKRLKEFFMEWRETTTCWENEVPVIEEINDRSFDVIESLLQVAQEGGSEWYEAIVSHAKASEQDDQEIDLTNEQKLLFDCRIIFNTAKFKSDKTFTPSQLQGWLIEDTVMNDEDKKFSENGWDFYSHGKPISLKAIARMLGKYGITSKRQASGKYYTSGDFYQAFQRYLDPLFGDDAQTTQATLTTPTEVQDVYDVQDSQKVTTRTRTKSQYNNYDPDIKEHG